MTEPQRVGDLEVHQDLEFQRRAWVVQRVGWAVMLLVVLAALLGAFGRGPLAKAQAGARGDPVWMEYERFTRHASLGTLKVHLAAGVAQNGKARVWLDRKYIQGVKIEDINPEPESVEAGQEGLVYVFSLADPAQPTTVTFHVQYDGYGSRRGGVGLAGREPLRFSQFVFP